MATKTTDYDITGGDVTLEIKEAVNRMTIATVQSGSAGTITYTLHSL